MKVSEKVKAWVYKIGKYAAIGGALPGTVAVEYGLMKMLYEIGHEPRMLGYVDMPLVPSPIAVFDPLTEMGLLGTIAAWWCGVSALYGYFDRKEKEAYSRTGKNPMQQG